MGTSVRLAWIHYPWRCQWINATELKFRRIKYKIIDCRIVQKLCNSNLTIFKFNLKRLKTRSIVTQVQPYSLYASISMSRICIHNDEPAHFLERIYINCSRGSPIVAEHKRPFVSSPFDALLTNRNAIK